MKNKQIRDTSTRNYGERGRAAVNSTKEVTNGVPRLRADHSEDRPQAWQAKADKVTDSRATAALGRSGRSVLSADVLREALVEYRVHHFQPVPCWKVGNVAFRDEYDVRHQGIPRRYFWLVHRGVQLVFEPFGWQGEWRVDLVEIDFRRGRRQFRVTDMAIDIVVEGMGPTYRALDLDDFAARMERGDFTAARAASVLQRTQEFLDSYLHRGAPWPPPEIRAWFDSSHLYPSV